MVKKIMALNDKGELTYCSAPPELRGMGRCNHIDHQNAGESVPDFVERVSIIMASGGIKEEEDVIVDQTPIIREIVHKYRKSFNENPDWEEVLKEKIPNHFVIGKGDTYEEATLHKVDQTSKIDENGDPVISLTGEYEFRGEKYTVDLGEIPEVQEDGTIIINGSKMRVLPVLAQHKSGLIRYREKAILKKQDGNIGLVYEVETGVASIRGKEVPLEEIQKHLNGEPSSLTAIQKSDIDEIDPIVYERFPDFKNDIKGVLQDHEPDEPNDISYRKVYTYEDQVRFELGSQMRRMGVTFRTNIARRQKAIDSGDPEQIAKAEEYPMFFQQNNKSNIISELTGRSNVQVAENLNPIAAISQSHKISLTGPGGYNKDKAPTMLRQVGESHKGKVDSLDLSSGKNIGLTLTVSNGELDKNGHLILDNKPSISPSDFIPFKYHNDLNRASMACAQMKQAVPISGGEDPRLLGDSSDKAWKEISGAKIGLNMNVSYYACEWTHEDGVAISESVAKKMMTKQSQKYDIRNPKDVKGIKVGDPIKRGQEIGGLKMKYQGIVKSIENGQLVVESEWKMREGDKIAGRHGNKGVVTKVLPDHMMPKIDKGNGKYERAEILMSPLAVVGRMNLGQIYETNSGDMNKVTKMELPNGRKVDSTSGVQYIMRLNHIAEKKLQSYSNEVGSDKESVGLRMGEMESLLLSSTENKRDVLNYLRNQEGSDAKNKLDSLLKSIGVSYRMNKE